MKSFEKVYSAVMNILDSASIREIADIWDPYCFDYEDYFENDLEELLSGKTPEEAFKLCYYADSAYCLNDEWAAYDGYGHLVSFAYEDQAFEFITGDSVDKMKADIASAVARFYTTEALEDASYPEDLEDLSHLASDYRNWSI